MRSISSFEYRSKRSRYSAGTSTSSYSPAFVPFLYRWHFFEKRLMMPWNSGPSPTGISTGITFGVSRSLIWPYTRSKSACSLSIRDTKKSRGMSRRSEEHTSELQSRLHLVCRLLLEKKKKTNTEKSKKKEQPKAQKRKAQMCL